MTSSFAFAIVAYDVDRHAPGLYSGRDCSSGLRCPEKRVRYSELNREDLLLGGDPIYHASYRYVTGRSGRTTNRDLYLCKSCGEKFAKKNKLSLPIAGCAAVEGSAS